MYGFVLATKLLYERWLWSWFYRAVFGEGSGVKFAEAVATPPAADAKVKILRNILYFLFFFLNYFFPYPRTHETRHCALSRSYNLDLLWNNYQASADDDDDDDMDLFGEETEEEKKAAEERAAAIKASAKKKESEF